MPRIPHREFLDLPLRVHSFLENVPLHDVWAVDLPDGGGRVTLAEFHTCVKTQGFKRIPFATKALLGLRLVLGRIFGLDIQTAARKSASYIRLLSEEDLSRSLETPGSKDAFFDVLYRFDNEVLLEAINATVHAFLAQALARTSVGYRLFLAVYVRPVSWVTRAYMALIDPFRRWIVYPQLLEKTQKDWAYFCSATIA
jgi:Protein of unknown function (DUF2867)